MEIIWDLYLDTRLAAEIHLFNEELSPLLGDHGQLLDNKELDLGKEVLNFNEKAQKMIADPDSLCFRMHPTRVCQLDLLPVLLDLMQYQSVPLTELAFKQVIALTNSTSFLLAKSCKVN